MTVGVLLLAAGRSVRFGSDKRLAALPNGNTIFETTLLNIQASKLPVMVCLEKDTGAVAEICDGLGVPRVVCENSSRGMGSTLAEGIGHISAWQGVLVALADMPYVQSATYARLGGLLLCDTICRPESEGQYGHPVGFGADYFPELRLQGGEEGARELLSKYAAKVRTLDCRDSGVLRDIDRVGDVTSISS